MSLKYSSSPPLQLKVHNSRIRIALFLTFCLAVQSALWLVYWQGYVCLALLLTPGTALLLWRVRHDPHVGTQLCWQQGEWRIEREGSSRPLHLSARSTALPWVIYVAGHSLPEGARVQFWLFGDSATPTQLRLLRVRLSLQRWQ